VEALKLLSEVVHRIGLTVGEADNRLDGLGLHPRVEPEPHALDELRSNRAERAVAHLADQPERVLLKPLDQHRVQAVEVPLNALERDVLAGQRAAGPHDVLQLVSRRAELDF
jgi:hypothetical protein